MSDMLLIEMEASRIPGLQLPAHGRKCARNKQIQSFRPPVPGWRAHPGSLSPGARGGSPSGNSKSLVCFSIDWFLLGEEKRDKNVPLPIHIRGVQSRGRE